jgi:CHAD domain-containing protein
MTANTVIESERKYDTPDGFVLPDLVGAGGVERVGDAHARDLNATYFDTDDLRLARNKMTLRRRTGGTDDGWHLKTPDGGDNRGSGKNKGDNRTEYRMPLGDGKDVPVELLDRVRAVVRANPLRSVVRLRTERREYPLQGADGRVLALLAEDRVRAEAGGDEQRWNEIEVELVDGEPDVLAALGERLRAAGAAPARTTSKLARALGEQARTRVGGAAAPATKADKQTSTKADKESSTNAGKQSGTKAGKQRSTKAGKQRSKRPPKAVRAVVDYVRAQRDAILANDLGVRAGDADAVHDMRVATRRLRSTLRTFRDRLWRRDRTEPLRAELAWLADRLGAVRDAQVMAARLREAVAALPARLVVGPVGDRIGARLDDDLRRGRRDLDAALVDARYFALLDALDRLVDTPPSPATRGRRVRRRAAAALRRADARLDRATTPDKQGRTTTPDKQASEGTGERERDVRLHDARKAYKRARYAVEALKPVRPKRARRLAKRLSALQDVLGDHQDTVITRDLLRQYADRADAADESAFSYGVLHANQRVAGADALAGLPAARRAATRRKLRRWLG